jgi:hypothetical protein
MENGLADLLITDLAQSQALRPLMADSIHSVLQVLGKTDETRLDEETLRVVASRTGANFTLSGRFLQADENLRVDFNLRRRAHFHRLFARPDERGATDLEHRAFALPRRKVALGNCARFLLFFLVKSPRERETVAPVTRGGGSSDGGVEVRERAPVRAGKSLSEERGCLLGRRADSHESAREAGRRFLRTRPVSPVLGRNLHPVLEELGHELDTRQTATAGGGIHDLDETMKYVPDHGKVGIAVGPAEDGDSGQVSRVLEPHVVSRDENLLGRQAEVGRKLLESLDSHASDGRWAGFTEPPVAHGNVVSYGKGLQGCPTAVHCQRLHDLRDEPLSASCHGSFGRELVCQF